MPAAGRAIAVVTHSLPTLGTDQIAKVTAGVDRHTKRSGAHVDVKRSVATAVAQLHRTAVVATEAHDTHRFGTRAAFPSDPRHFHRTRDTL